MLSEKYKPLLINSVRCFLFCLLFIVAPQSFANIPLECDPNPFSTSGVGPWDYYDKKNYIATGANPMGRIRRVTNVHLTKAMLRLTGKATGTISSDLDYTLRAIPNHPQALDLASRFEQKLSLKSTEKDQLFRNERMARSAECYFKRAINLTPNQPRVYHIYGIHLHRMKKYAKAVEIYSTAEKLGLEDVEFQYNYALSLVKEEQYEKAETLARKAYQQGYPLPGLKNLLQEKGYCAEGCSSAG